MAVSSANILVLVLWMSEKGKSLQYTMYSSGESTEPWGTSPGGRRLLDSSVSWRRLVKILSKILPVMLRSEMGR
jgi:hypothetical protein